MAGPLFVLLILYLGLQLLLTSGVISDYIYQRYTIINIVASGGSTRIDIWKVGFNLFKDNLWFGVGFENFPYAFQHYIPLTNIEGYVNLFEGPHNDWLRIGGELGLIGLLIFIILQINISLSLIKSIQQKISLEIYYFSLIIFGLLIYTLCNGFFSSFIWRKSYWLILSLASIIPLLHKYYFQNTQSFYQNE